MDLMLSDLLTERIFHIGGIENVTDFINIISVQCGKWRGQTALYKDGQALANQVNKVR